MQTAGTGDRAAPSALSEAEKKVRVKKNGQNLAARVAPMEQGRLAVCVAAVLEQFSRVHWQMES